MKVDILRQTWKMYILHEKIPKSKFILFILDGVWGLIWIQTFLKILEKIPKLKWGHFWRKKIPPPPYQTLSRIFWFLVNLYSLFQKPNLNHKYLYPNNKNDPNEEDSLKIEDDPKKEIDPKNEDNPKNDGNPNSLDFPKNEYDPNN